MGNDFNDGLSERGLLGVLWDSWDLVLVVWGVGFGLTPLCLNWDFWDWKDFWDFVVSCLGIGFLFGRVFMATGGGCVFVILPLRLFRGAGLASSFGFRVTSPLDVT